MSLATSGQAVVAAAQQRSLILPVAEDFTSTPGRGVSATISGRTIQVGSPALLRPAQMTEVTWDEATAAVKTLEARGRTAVLVVVDGVPAVVDVSRQAHRLVRANLVFASTMMAPSSSSTSSGSCRYRSRWPDTRDPPSSPPSTVSGCSAARSGTPAADCAENPVTIRNGPTNLTLIVILITFDRGLLTH